MDPSLEGFEVIRMPAGDGRRMVHDARRADRIQNGEVPCVKSFHESAEGFHFGIFDGGQVDFFDCHYIYVHFLAPFCLSLFTNLLACAAHFPARSLLNLCSFFSSRAQAKAPDDAACLPSPRYTD